MKRVLFDVAALITRLTTGVIFLVHGWEKWRSGFGATAQQFKDMGVAVPELATGYTTVVETIGGLLLIVGLLVRPVALLLFIGMLAAMTFVHGAEGVMTADNGWELAGALGALTLLFLTLGGGRLGLDGLFNAIFRRRAERRVAEEELAAHAPVRQVEPTQEGGPTTPAPTQPMERPHVPRQQAPSGSPRLNDQDMRDIDALIADEPPEHRKPPNR
ncbi:DoxX family protein [Nonomuraea jiangxiensis]|uniref:Putative oxidoreductase n=1 Tax=Nonomuraea jiangxiensis TaxID=633440 RepID=A0A1G8XNK3_9ACTN|nr:DoxX family protein [Nonomuraea jiangxiensis]SDJ92073.1 putative oxidoreductase [Nonomuraea jiangxiensis]